MTRKFRDVYKFVSLSIKGKLGELYVVWTFRRSRPEVFCEKHVVNIFAKFTENTCVGVSFLIKLQGWGNFTLRFHFYTP